MPKVYRFFLLIVAVCLGPTAVWADVVVTTQLGLAQLQINPNTGTLMILPPVTASTFAQALDSNGDFSQSDDNPANAATAFANGSGAASVSDLTGSVSANINLPDGFDGFASSAGDAVLFGVFEISGTGSTDPVNVTFNASLSINQFLQTIDFGQFASSETIFTLLLPDLSPDPVLFFDNPLTIGANDLLSYSDSPTLTTSMFLQPDTPYTFVASLDAESSGVNVTPEPSSLGLALTLLGLMAVLGRLTKKSCPDKRG